MKKTLLASLLLCASTFAGAQQMTYDLTKKQPTYTAEGGYGYDLTKAPEKNSNDPFYFSVKVPDGNYRVTVTLGSKKKMGETTVRAENRRLMVERCVTGKNKFETYSFLVHKHSVDIPAYTNGEGKQTKPSKVKIKQRENGSLSWDEKLTLEFNGSSPCVKSITIEPDKESPTLYLCGNSTVVDQAYEPWASWGQMVTRWFDDKVCVANFAESGLTTTTFMAQNRLEKILSMIRPGDYVICEFGHNDEKEHGPGTGAWYHYTVALKKLTDLVKAKQGNVIMCTPTVRRAFEKDNKTVRETHGDFPEAMRTLAKRENLPLIDLNKQSSLLLLHTGMGGSKHIYVHFPMGTFPWQTKAFEDNTHFTPFGAYELSKLVIQELKNMKHPLAEHLRDDWTDFIPYNPDNSAEFYWPQSIFHDGAKPDGN